MPSDRGNEGQAATPVIEAEGEYRLAPSATPREVGCWMIERFEGRDTRFGFGRGDEDRDVPYLLVRRFFRDGSLELRETIADTVRTELERLAGGTSALSDAGLRGILMLVVISAIPGAREPLVSIVERDLLRTAGRADDLIDRTYRALGVLGVPRDEEFWGRRMKRDPRPAVFQAALRILGRVDVVNSVRLVVQALEEGDGRTRAAAAGAGSVLPMLMTWWREEDPGTRDGAAFLRLLAPWLEKLPEEVRAGWEPYVLVIQPRQETAPSRSSEEFVEGLYRNASQLFQLKPAPLWEMSGRSSIRFALPATTSSDLHLPAMFLPKLPPPGPKREEEHRPDLTNILKFPRVSTSLTSESAPPDRVARALTTS